ncbi:MAG TPA: hypothetical protein VGG02_01450 [Chthoniobacterales bacterium]
MRLKLFNFVAIVLLLSATFSHAQTRPHSTSTSRQFIVYGAGVPERGAVCDLAETTKANLLNLLGQPDRWQTTLIINLQSPQANLPEIPRSSFDFSQLGSGLKMQLNLLVTDDLDARQIQREILRAILIEIMYREHANVAPGTPYATPPDWLVDGFSQLMPGGNADEGVELLQTAVEDNRIPPLEEIVTQKRALLDPPSQKVHDAYSMALVQLLLDAPDGRRKVARFIDDLPDAPNDAMENLRAHFPAALGDSAARWWSLSVAHLSATDRYQILTVAETAKRLDQLLKISLPLPGGRPKTYSLGEYSALLRRRGGRAALRLTSERLLLLGARANPTYYEIVQEYYRLAATLARGRTRKIRQRLAHVKNYRETVDQQNGDIDDYMNWFEATQLTTMSGAFSDLLRNFRADSAPERRRDPISVYLDSIEAQTAAAH